MKTIKTLAFAAAALFVVASCEKSAPVSDAVVGFETEAYEFAIEQGPNFEIPISVTGSNIVYPFTIKVTNVAETEENGYSERNVDYRFIERDIVVESAEDKPSVVVRVINDDLESLLMGIQIKEVSNGTINASSSKVEVSADFGLNATAGIYTVAGTLDGETYSEPWFFLNAGGDFIGFWGLLGMFDVDEYWPIYGDAVYNPEDNTALMTFSFTLDNYITIEDFGAFEAYVVPVLRAGNSLSMGNVQMLSDSNGTIMIGLPEGYGITFALFDAETEAFTGYTYGGLLMVNNNTITRTAGVPAAVAAEAAAAGQVVVEDIKTGEFKTLPFKSLPKPEKNFRK